VRVAVRDSRNNAVIPDTNSHLGSGYKQVVTPLLPPLLYTNWR